MQKVFSGQEIRAGERGGAKASPAFLFGMDAENLSNWDNVGTMSGQCWIMLENLQYVHGIQSPVISFPDLIGHMHVVRMSELTGDRFDRDACLFHE